MTDKIKVHRFKNNETTTPYAPTWDFIVAEKRTDLDVKGLAKILLDGTIDHFFFPGVEQAPLAGSLRFKDKNILKVDHPLCKQLHEEIRNFHNEYVNATIGQFDRKIDIKCWANIMRKGSSLPRHFHSSKHSSYLSGHLSVQCEDTSTNYYHPYIVGEYPTPNFPGQMTIFPSWVPHDTSIHNGDSERITIAFDFIPEGTPLEDLDTFYSAKKWRNDRKELIPL